MEASDMAEDRLGGVPSEGEERGSRSEGSGGEPEEVSFLGYFRLFRA